MERCDLLDCSHLQIYNILQVVPGAEAEVLQEPPLARLARLYYKPAALIFASSHMLATACALTGQLWSSSWLARGSCSLEVAGS